LERLKSFYEEYFGGQANQKYHNPKTGLQTYFLSFGDGARLEIMMKPGVASGIDGQTAGFTHLAFCVGAHDAVDALTKRLTDDGYTLKSAPRTTGDGYYESCVLDPDGNEVEVISNN
jgi:lactoylglutathione lyase